MALPTRLKLDIRDQWANEACELQKAFRQIQQIIGTEVECAPDWPLLWTELKSFFSEPSTFIPSVASVITIWCNSFCEFVRDEQKEQKWVEQVENVLSETNKLRISVEIARKEFPSTIWAEEERAFIVFLPKSGPRVPSDIASSIRPDMLGCFKPLDLDAIRHFSAEALPEDSWANIEVDSTTGSAQEEPARVSRSAVVRPIITTLPDIYIMERPDFLTLKPPYHLTISSAFQNIIRVQCSHPPTLMLLEKYLKKWTKRELNHRKQLPAALLTLKESPFGLGAIYTALEIKLQDSSSYDSTPMFVVSFVQSMLGYTLTREDNAYWAFKRETAFQS
ncbi:hypothetical protein BCR34DRAFT_662610 [Clohesyomyces aquaticus]|uniref:Uncharacterized protein n=1 Tax=Clohesyomyces aquaticus TaxID=1231657 RepID=A0A1Y1ZWC3_9PLEO|nr:hypothetical protein BCR34DRAFT_662610 [Clohesyomyces aquaticus]